MRSLRISAITLLPFGTDKVSRFLSKKYTFLTTKKNLEIDQWKLWSMKRKSIYRGHAPLKRPNEVWLNHSPCAICPYLRTTLINRTQKRDSWISAMKQYIVIRGRGDDSLHDIYFIIESDNDKKFKMSNIILNVFLSFLRRRNSFWPIDYNFHVSTYKKLSVLNWTPLYRRSCFDINSQSEYAWKQPHAVYSFISAWYHIDQIFKNHHWK